jgi:uncharacterized membrane protein YhaH (DUF805 family)
MNLTELLFSFTGRIKRLHWWITNIVTLGVAALADILIDFGAEATGNLAVDPETAEATPTGLFLVAALVVSVIDLWIAFALAAKRLHDRDRTGWWLAVQFLLAALGLIGFLVVVLVPGMQEIEFYVPAVILGAGAIGVSLWLFIEMGFLKGTAGTNRFGPDPLGPSQPKAEFKTGA